MPWSAKQLKLFRAASHNPAFAKKVGIKRSDAKRMSHEGLKKAEGGIVSKKFEGSAKDKAQDVKLAKKHGMSFKAWEKTKMDDKHDKQESMKGLKKGGSPKGYCRGGGIEARGKTRGRMV